MLRGEIFIKRLAAEAQIEIATSSELWQAYVLMLERLLLEGHCVDLSPLGYWSSELQAESLAVLGQDVYLCPPSLELSIAPSLCGLSSEALGFAQLAYATELPEAVIVRWLGAIPSLTLDLLHAGQEVLWPRLGLWRLQDGVLSFEPCEELCASLNKPFEHFRPQLIAARELYSDLACRELSSLDELAKTRTISWSLSKLELEIAQNVDLAVAEAEILPVPVADTLAPEDEPQRGLIDETSEPLPVVKGRPSYWFIALFLLTLVLIALAVYYFTRPAKAHQPITLVMLEKLDTLPKALQVSEASSDSLPSAPQLIDELPESRDSITPRQTKTEAERTRMPAPKPSTAQSQTPREVETYANQSEEVELMPDESLAHIAKRKYGHRAFWVYIYEENRERIVDPHKVPIGTKLELPPASKYGIDPRNTKSLERALVLSKSLENNNY